MPERTLTPRELNRALLARQLLLERVDLSIPEALEQVGGLQTQYAPSGYVGLWSRLANFQRGDLTRALESRTVVQATLMRVTIHLVSAADYWPYSIGVRRARQEWWLRMHRGKVTGADMERSGEDLRAALAAGPRSVAELGDLAKGFLGNLALWVDLVRVPPSGTWERRRADRLALVDAWLGPCHVTEADGLAHLVRAYLRAFGPAPYRDIATWAGTPVTPLKEAGERLDLVRYRDENGRNLVDIPGAPLPEASTPAPVRFLAHWDASLLVHARRTGVLPERHRARVFTSKNPFSVGTYLVDGYVAGAWQVREGRIELEPYDDVPAAAWREVQDERERLEEFHR
jgi:hypothetical protein